ncbi:hypothetical protein DAEQUDRAFT_812410 [Daedalea quercina L-15889]|uniref:Uncharacterized protein n=1 Tax=Daedalea quercina L-15889 TaxID=1314783 RepID=A0A165PDL1_9APHY|nr:hypothetical protein DAEQUDRAFT_812410 [Daedalea quercina L-15889]
MSKWSANDGEPFSDLDLQELFEAREWHSTWQEEYGEYSGDESESDGNGPISDEDDNIDAQIEHAVRSAATHLANHYKCMLEDSQEGDRSQALDPRTLFRLLTAEKTRARAIEETTSALKKSSLAQEKWSDASVWELQAKLELSLTLESMIPAERPNVGPESLRYTALLRTLPTKARDSKRCVSRGPAATPYARLRKRGSSGPMASHPRHSPLRYCSTATD